MNVLLVEDDHDLACTVIDYLALEQIDSDHASNGVAALNLLRSHRYDVILLDINLPRLNGFSVCQQLRLDGLDTPVIMLTARDQLSDKLEGFRAGTDDYLVKPFELEELVVRLQSLARRRSGQVQQLQYRDLTMNLSERQVSRGGERLHLSPSNWTLLEVLLRAAPASVTKNQLERALWGDDSPDSNALKVHMFKLRKAINIDGAPALIHTLSGFGFVLREDPNDAS
ncbi:MAG: response regulator transcription factor [Zhongshania sp.]|uniref:response regulator transcription factor n=1 Tax=Zhongshania sp. TaxID=1971902 RepID=UPI00262D22E5|nr:response regulator transcription factor [Zhongshania sp.]MDF1693516.1 response regulator transcription factor [Zhongshania sp.]